VQREPYQIDDAEVSNVFIERRGTTAADQVVVVGAHYDTVPTTPGADDNASAVAVLIETARLLRDFPCRRTIRFVAFACEEPPYFFTESMGSRVHASGCRQRGEAVTAMVCLEMVGYYSDAPGSQQVPGEIPRWLRWLFPTRGDCLAAVGNLRSGLAAWRFHRGFCRASDLRLFSVVLPESVYVIRFSDNSSFWDQGYPALMVTDTSFLRNPHYHLPTDTPDTLDYARMARATLGVAGGVARLAGGRWRPEKPGHG
jgi:Zn-dependent M28 family amino/carboxypeptidase